MSTITLEYQALENYFGLEGVPALAIKKRQKHSALPANGSLKKVGMKNYANLYFLKEIVIPNM